MKQPEILERVDKKRLQKWLLIAGQPLLREPSFFEEMGFSSFFVRQYFRKHRYVLQPGGAIQQKVRGINEVDFLYGLAEAIGINTSEMTIRNDRNRRAEDIARECLRVLDEVDGDVNDKETQCTIVPKEAVIETL